MDAKRARPPVRRGTGRVTGPGGRLVIGRDEQGRAIVENLPATLPGLFRTFCALNADKEAVVAGEERLTFADLDRVLGAAGAGLVARGIVKGDRVGIAMRNCPSWILSYMGVIKAGGVATLLNGWWEAARDGACDPSHRAQADHRRCSAREAHRRTCADSDICSASPSSCLSSRRLQSCSTETGLGFPRSPRRRCDDPLHVGVDRDMQGRAVDAPRGHDRRLRLCDRTHRAPRHSRAGGPRARRHAADFAKRAFVPRDGRSAGDAQQLRHRPVHGHHAQVGPDAKRFG